jgi:phosphate transport system permease protein
MKLRPPTGRRLTNLAVSIWAGGSALLGILILFWILYVVLARGLGALNLAFFTQMPTPPGISGGGGWPMPSSEPWGSLRWPR